MHSKDTQESVIGVMAWQECITGVQVTLSRCPADINNGRLERSDRWALQWQGSFYDIRSLHEWQDGKIMTSLMDLS
jgi:hypothetical protein